MENRRAVIVSGGEIDDYGAILGYLRDDDYFVFADKGLLHREGLGVPCHLAVGDFDSVPAPSCTETVVLPRTKDETDTFSAVSLALERGFRRFLLLGMTGGRTDHAAANIYILSYLTDMGAEGMVVDGWCEMEEVRGRSVTVADSYPFFSLIAWKGSVDGVTIENARYPLSQARIDSGFQYAVSNEPLGGGARVSVAGGSVLLVRVRRA